MPAWAAAVLNADVQAARVPQPWTVPSSKVLLTTTTGSAASAAGASVTAVTAPATTTSARPTGTNRRNDDKRMWGSLVVGQSPDADASGASNGSPRSPSML